MADQYHHAGYLHLRFLFLTLLGGYFIYSGIIKITDVPLFASQIQSYQLLPSWTSFYTAAGLPVYEMVSGLLLLIRRTRAFALLSILLMLAVFTVALISALIRGLEINCGCTGGDEISTAGLYMSLFRNLLFLSGGAWIYLRIKKSLTGRCRPEASK